MPRWWALGVTASSAAGLYRRDWRHALESACLHALVLGTARTRVAPISTADPDYAAELDYAVQDVFDQTTMHRAAVIEQLGLPERSRQETAALGPDVDRLLRLLPRLLGRTPGGSGEPGASRPPGLVLDVGAGLGGVAASMQSWGCRVIAIEPAPGSLEGMRRLFPSVATVHASADALPFPDDAADATTLIGVVSLTGLRQVVREVARVLSPGGPVVLADMFASSSSFLAGPIA